MRALALLLLISCGGKAGDDAATDDSGRDLTWRPCRTWCEDLAQTYGALTTPAAGAADTTLPGWSTGAYDPDEYIASCAAAPEDGQCETCSGFYFDGYLQPAAISASCDFVYRPGPAQAAALTADELAARTAECEDHCDDYGLAF